MFFFPISKYLCGGQHRVLIQAEDGVGRDGLVGQEAAAHHLHGETQSSSGSSHTSLTRRLPQHSLVWSSAERNVDLKVVQNV